MRYYTNEHRGTFQNEQYAKQLVSFEGMKYRGRSGYRNVTPTDIDGFIQLDENNCFIFFELKRSGIPSVGQGSALTSLVDAVSKSGSNCVLFVAQHDEQSENTIIAKDSIVNRIYWNGKWYSEHHRRTLGELIDTYINNLEKEGHDTNKTKETGNCQRLRI